MLSISQIQEVIRHSICCSCRCRNSITIPLPILQIIVRTASHQFNVQTGEPDNLHHPKFYRNHQCNADIECSEARRVAWRFASQEKVRRDDLTNAVGHEEHHLLESVLSFRLKVRRLTPHVAFFVKPPMLEETRLMHMIYGIVFTRRTGRRQLLPCFRSRQTYYKMHPNGSINEIWAMLEFYKPRVEANWH
jgi:hypothetical protein